MSNKSAGLHNIALIVIFIIGIVLGIAKVKLVKYSY